MLPKSHTARRFHIPPKNQELYGRRRLRDQLFHQKIQKIRVILRQPQSYQNLDQQPVEFQEILVQPYRSKIWKKFLPKNKDLENEIKDLFLNHYQQFSPKKKHGPFEYAKRSDLYNLKIGIDWNIPEDHIITHINGQYPDKDMHYILWVNPDRQISGFNRELNFLEYHEKQEMNPVLKSQIEARIKKEVKQKGFELLHDDHSYKYTYMYLEDFSEKILKEPCLIMTPNLVENGKDFEYYFNRNDELTSIQVQIPARIYVAVNNHLYLPDPIYQTLGNRELPDRKYLTPETNRILEICENFKAETRSWIEAKETKENIKIYQKSLDSVVKYIDPLCPLAWKSEKPGKEIYHMWNTFDPQMMNSQVKQQIIRQGSEFEIRYQTRTLEKPYSHHAISEHPNRGWIQLNQINQYHGETQKNNEIYEIPPFASEDHARRILENIQSYDWCTQTKISLEAYEDYENYVKELTQALISFAHSISGNQEIFNLCSQYPELDTDFACQFLKQRPEFIPVAQSWPAIFSILMQDTVYTRKRESKLAEKKQVFFTTRQSSTGTALILTGGLPLQKKFRRMVQLRTGKPLKPKKELLGMIFGKNAKNYPINQMDALAKRLPFPSPNEVLIQSREVRNLLPDFQTDFLMDLFSPGTRIQQDLLSLPIDLMPKTRDEWIDLERFTNLWKPTHIKYQNKPLSQTFLLRECWKKYISGLRKFEKLGNIPKWRKYNLLENTIQGGSPETLKKYSLEIRHFTYNVIQKGERLLDLLRERRNQRSLKYKQAYEDICNFNIDIHENLDHFATTSNSKIIKNVCQKWATNSPNLNHTHDQAVFFVKGMQSKDSNKNANKVHRVIWPTVLTEPHYINQYVITELNEMHKVYEHANEMQHCIGSYVLDCLKSRNPTHIFQLRTNTKNSKNSQDYPNHSKDEPIATMTLNIHGKDISLDSIHGLKNSYVGDRIEDYLKIIIPQIRERLRTMSKEEWDARILERKKSRVLFQMINKGTPRTQHISACWDWLICRKIYSGLPEIPTSYFYDRNKDPGELPYRNQDNPLNPQD